MIKELEQRDSAYQDLVVFLDDRGRIDSWQEEEYAPSCYLWMNGRNDY